VSSRPLAVALVALVDAVEQQAEPEQVLKLLAEFCVESRPLWSGHYIGRDLDRRVIDSLPGLRERLEGGTL
jgi:hypothetical protein